MRKGLVSAFIIFCFCPYLARADTRFPANCSNPVPDISGWEVFQISRIEFRSSDEVAAYLGASVTYVKYDSSGDSKELIQIIYRHVPGIFSEKKLTNEQLFRETVVVLYNQKDRDDFFDEIGNKTDPISYVHWRVKEHPRTGNDVEDGDADVWFLRSNGECLTVKNERVRIQFMTENVGDGKPRNVFVGVKYQIGDTYHILEVDRRDLVRLIMEGGK